MLGMCEGTVTGATPRYSPAVFAGHSEMSVAEWIAEAVAAETAQAGVDRRVLARALVLLAAKHAWSTLDIVAAGAAASGATTTAAALTALVQSGESGGGGGGESGGDNCCVVSATTLLSRVRERVEKRLVDG